MPPYVVCTRVEHNDLVFLGVSGAFTGKEFTVPTPGTRFVAGTTYKIAPLAIDVSATKVTAGSLADVTYSLRGGDSVASGAWCEG